MNIIELKPLREWEEKDGSKPTGNIRIYIGHIHVGTCRKIKNPTGDIPKYHFRSMYMDITMSIPTNAMTMDEIKSQVECCFKEFSVKYLKSFRSLKPKAN